MCEVTLVLDEPTINGKTREQWLVGLNQDNPFPYTLPEDVVDRLFSNVSDDNIGSE